MLTLCGNNASLVIFLGWVGPPPPLESLGEGIKTNRAILPPEVF